MGILSAADGRPAAAPGGTRTGLGGSGGGGRFGGNCIRSPTVLSRGFIGGIGGWTVADDGMAG